jgi:hypothetical protein
MRKIALAFAIIAAALALSGCGAITGYAHRPAQTVAHNMSAAADHFQVIRRITVRNAHTDALIASIEGYCAVWLERRTPWLVVVCANSDGTFVKHWYGLDNATYSIEQPVGVVVPTDHRNS